MGNEARARGLVFITSEPTSIRNTVTNGPWENRVKSYKVHSSGESPPSCGGWDSLIQTLHLFKPPCLT